MTRFRLPLMLGLALALGGTALSAEAGCSAAARQTINNAAAQEQQADQSNAIRQFVQQSNAPGTIGSGGMTQCAGESFPIQLPGVASILSGVAKSVIQQACNQARSAVSQQMPSYLKGLYNVVSTNGVNTSTNQIVNSASNSATSGLTSNSAVNGATNTAVKGLFGGGQ